MKRRTRAELESENSALRAQQAEISLRLNSAYAETKEVRSQFSELKERLLNAENQRQLMLGYIKRVQEDDVVREELVLVGEPGGEQTMVPKRKPTGFPGVLHHCPPSDMGEPMISRFEREMRGTPRHRHWVSY